MRDILFVCVGTPSNRNGSINLRYVANVIKKINYLAKNEKILIVIKSTVLPGTISKKLVKLITKKIFLFVQTQNF